MASPTDCVVERITFSSNGETACVHFELLYQVSRQGGRWIKGDALEIFFNLVRVVGTVQDNFFYTSVCQEFKSVFEERGVC
jgi:hypothetical protein